ncbi:MAG: hypothetical protein FJY82_13925 [Candidatus Aminicenantes bacterium]|nr:hypothetical protein [Candidatus Aminicenantes bacterium]
MSKGRGPRSRKTAAAIAAGVVLFAAAAAVLRGEEPPPPEKRFGPLEKSLLVPGWGQLSEKRYFEGFAFFGAEVACLIGFFRNDRLGNERYALYKAAASVEDAVRRRREVEMFDRRRNGFLLAAAAVWAANLVDIVLILKSRGGGRPAALKFGCDGPDEIRISLACRF